MVLPISSARLTVLACLQPAERVEPLERLEPDGVPPASGRRNKKVSLERYRNASTAIFKILLDVVGPGNCEKAGLDEVSSCTALSAHCLGFVHALYGAVMFTLPHT